MGRALIERLVKNGFTNLVTVSRNEGQLIKLKEQFPCLTIITGNIDDPFICEKVCADVDGIFHLAAFKHVGLAEENVRQCVQSNVFGAFNLLEQTFKRKPDFIIGISTDKVITPKGVYGATKLLQERLFKEYESINPETKYRIVRYGNVIYSTGSVLCKWKDKLQKGEEIVVTDLQATRFYWTVEEAIDLIFACLDKADNSNAYVPIMKSVTIDSLLEAMIAKYLPSGMKPKIKIIGLQPGEKLHETILEDGPDSSQVPRFTQEEIAQFI